MTDDYKTSSLQSPASSLTILFTAPELEEPFELVTEDDDQGGSKPVQVERSRLDFSVQGSVAWAEALKVEVPGVRRVKLYCSEKVAATARILVNEGEAKRIGRRTEPVTETLTWSREHTRRLRFFHDRPEVEIVEQTLFRDTAGNTVDAPLYNPATGEFHSPVKVTGALVVRYEAGFSLFEITYGNGQEVASQALFAEMQKAWRSGDVEAVGIPPVRIIALSDWHAAQAEFPRKIWPRGDTRFIFRTVSSRFGEEPDHNDPRLSSDSYSEIPGKRRTVTQRIFHPDDPEIWLDVRRTVYLEARDLTTGRILKLQLINHGND